MPQKNSLKEQEKSMSTTTRRDQAQDHVERAKESAGSAVDKAKETAGNIADKAKDAASSIADRAKDAATNVGQAASNVASTIGHKAEEATASVGGGIQSLGHTVREKGPESGMLGSATEAVAGALESSGKYLEDKNLTGMVDDLSGLIRRNPIPALLLGIGIGFLLARTLRS